MKFSGLFAYARAQFLRGAAGALLLTMFAFAHAQTTHAQTTHAQTTNAPAEPLPFDELRIFADVFGKIKSEYIDHAADAGLLRDAIHGMLAGLDPHSAFLDEEEYEDMRVTTSGRFGGLGIEIITEDGLIKVIAPIDDTPAQRAGILPGDLIIKIDDEIVDDANVRDAVGSLRGTPGSKVRLTISREGVDDAFEVQLTRAVIKVASVKSELLEKDFAYVRITRFQTGTGESLREHLANLARENGRALKGVALDLRNNPGGVLQGAVEVSDAFLESGIIVTTRGRNEESNYRARAPDVLSDAPLVVLVNAGSASASEIVAGALQDHKRALIIGAQTFGKGSVQTIIPVDDGGALKLTTARYYTPANRSIQARGIDPDIALDAVTPARTKTRRMREQDLPRHLENDSPPAEEDSTAAARDYQISEALNLLKGMSLVKTRGDNAAMDSTPASDSAADFDEDSGEG